MDLLYKAVYENNGPRDVIRTWLTTTVQLLSSRAAVPNLFVATDRLGGASSIRERGRNTPM